MGALTKAINYTKQNGLFSLVPKVAYHVWFKVSRFFKYKYRSFRSWFTKKNYFAGKIVEWTGNRRSIDGIVMDLDNHYIKPKFKSRFLFDTYEQYNKGLMESYMSPKYPFVEFGACIGFVSNQINRFIDDPTKQVVVEAHTGLIPTLTKNRDLNDAKFHIEHAAVAYGQDEVTFLIDPNNLLGCMLTEEEGAVPITVPSINLQKIVDKYGYERFSFLCNIEGHELALIENEMDLIAERVDTMIMEFHPFDWGCGKEGASKIHRTLTERGFMIQEYVGDNQCAYINTRFYPDAKSNESKLNLHRYW